MNTDWARVRDLMAAAIDTCERIEQAGFREEDRGLTTDIGGTAVSLNDMMVSAWTLPENLRYRIIRARHEEGSDLSYIPETARILTAMAAAAAELIGAGHQKPESCRDELDRALDWYRSHATSILEQFVQHSRGDSD